MASSAVVAGAAEWAAVRGACVSPPAEWPESFHTPQLGSFISETLGGKRVRACGAPSAASAEKIGAVPLAEDDSLFNAKLVRSKTGWEVLAGYALYERSDVAAADGSPVFIARPFWWNVKKNGAWVDATPRDPPESELVLVESDKVSLALTRSRSTLGLIIAHEKVSAPSPLAKEKGSDKRDVPTKPVAMAGASDTRGDDVDPKSFLMDQQRIAAEYNKKMERKAKFKGLSKEEKKQLKEAEMKAAQAQAEAMAAIQKAERERAEAAEQAVIEAARRAAAEKEAQKEAKRAAEQAKRDAAVAEAARAAKRAEEATREAETKIANNKGLAGFAGLAEHLALVMPAKEAGGKYFALEGHLEEAPPTKAPVELVLQALAEYLKGSTTASRATSLAWPAVESAVIACHANAALCLRKLGRPSEAEAQCDAALSLPMAHASGATMIGKLYLRKLQAMIDQSEDPMATEDRYEDIVNFISAIYRLGLCDEGSSVRGPFAEQIARLDPPPKPLEPYDSDVHRLEKVVEVVLGAFLKDRPSNAPPLGTLVEDLGAVLEFDKMAPRSALAVDKLGRSLLWALSHGLLSNPNNETITFFCKALPFLFESWRPNGKVPADFRLPDIDTPNENATCTALMYAARAGAAEAVDVLLRHGASVNMRNNQGTGALLYACMPSQGPEAGRLLAVVKRLLDARAEVDSQDIAGQTALMYAATQLDSTLLKTLLDAGADKGIRDSRGRTAIAMIPSNVKDAQARERESCLSLLLDQSGPLRKIQDLELRTAEFMRLLKVHLAAVGENHPAAPNAKRTLQKSKQELALVQALMVYFSLDCSKLTQQSGPFTNFYETLHAKLCGLIPPALLKVYQEAPEEDEFALILSMSLDAATRAEEKAGALAKEHGDLRTAAYDAGTFQSLALVPFRRRGKVAQCMQDFQNLVALPLRRVISHAIPSEKALKAIAKMAPIVEMGAGSGYWTAMLKERGVDVLAFDISPPSEGNANYEYATRQFTNVQCGDSTLFGSNTCDGGRLHERALLLVWPNQDVIDEDDPAVDPWDLECLQDYWAAGGQTVIYVGERTECVETLLGAPVDSGISASKRFQVMLHAKFSLVETVKIPTLLYALDDCSIWKRK